MLHKTKYKILKQRIVWYRCINIEAKKSLVVQVHGNVILELRILQKVFIAYDVTTHNHNHHLCTLLQQLTAHLTEGCGAGGMIL